MKLNRLIFIAQIWLLVVLASPFPERKLKAEISLSKTVRAGSCFAAFVTCPSTRVSSCAAGHLSTTACPGRKVVDNDYNLHNNLKDKGGEREYFLPLPTTGTELTNIQSTGMTYALTYNALHPLLQGSRTYSPDGPPGWDELPPDGRQRGHLWSKNMGGPGGFYLNVITMVNTTNGEMNNQFECKIKKAFEDMKLDKLSRVFVTILVRYSRTTKVSKKIFLFADVEYHTSRGWVMEPWLGMEIKNRYQEKMNRLFQDRTAVIKRASTKDTDDSSCLDQTTIMSTLSFHPAMPSNNDWWTLSRGSGSPTMELGGGEVWFTGKNQSTADASMTIASKTSYRVNGGIAFRFLLSPYRFSSSETTLEFAGGIGLRFRSGASPGWYSFKAWTPVKKLATSAMTAGPGWYDIHIVYTSTKVILWERGVKKFTLSTTFAPSFPFKATFTNSDKFSETDFKISNVAIHQNLF